VTPTIAKTYGTVGAPSIERWVPDILRAGVAGCFIGHGAFGVITKAAWVPYFAVGGIHEPLAWRLMPWVGTMDIAIGILAFAWPCRALFLWAALWAGWTASLRPLSGESVWEFLERGGNYGVPLTILVATGTAGPLFQRLTFQWTRLNAKTENRLSWALRLTTICLLVGHAGLGLFIHKASLADHYAALGISQPAALVPAVGAFEFSLAALVLFRPSLNLLLGICLWKIATESLFLVVGAPIWEVIERFGSFTAPLALALLLSSSRGDSHPSAVIA
jgi:hypothetical protein